MNLMESIMRHEGYRPKAYQDTEGVWTIGYGTNLQELVIDEGTAYEWLLEAVRNARREAGQFEEWHFLANSVREDVFVEMIYNMGAPRLRGFKKMLAAVRRRDWEDAAKEMLDSRWATQVGRRAQRLAERMRLGTYEDAG